MGTYAPNGRSHRVLRRLAEGSARFERLQEIACAGLSPAKRAKFVHLTRALRADGLIAVEVVTYRIEPAGREALARLDAGETVVATEARPNVRIFTRQELAHA